MPTGTNQKHAISLATWLKMRFRGHLLHPQPPTFCGFHPSELPEQTPRPQYLGPLGCSKLQAQAQTGGCPNGSTVSSRGKKMTFLQNDPRRCATLKQVFLDRFELVVAHFGPPKIPKCLERRQSVTEGPGSPRRKRPQLQQGDAQSHTAVGAPDGHGSPAGAPLPMSWHALSYLQLTGAITPERASRIVVVSTPKGQRTPLPTRSPEQPPHEKGRDIPPGIARMLQQIRTPQARPQPLPPRRETRPNARTSHAAALPTGPPAGFNIISNPSPRVLSRPGQYSPSPAWSPAVTSSWHSVRHVSPEHWSPACTPGGGGSNRQQDSPHLPPVLLAPLFESAMSTPRRDTTQSASDEDVQQYAVRCSAPPNLPPTLLAPLFESVMSAPRAGSTHRECDEDMGQYEVQYSVPPSVGECPPNPFTFSSLRGAQRLCTELPGMARQGQGWVRDPHARHSTMLYSMQESTLSPNSAAGLMKHGRASREAT